MTNGNKILVSKPEENKQTIWGYSGIDIRVIFKLLLKI
jgi:hypothetical protein